MDIDIKETQKWYADARGIGVDGFDDYDANICRVANAYGNMIKKLSISDASSSFTADEVVNELEQCDTLDDAIMFFKQNWIE